jgi:hypothetical protein
LFGLAAADVNVSMQAPNDLEDVLGVTLFAVGRGANGMAIDCAAVQLVRQRFGSKIQEAVEDPLWRKKWQAEHRYVLGQAEAMGECAARLAAEGRRAVITPGDVEMAMLKLRGRLPIAGRWCPF